MEWSIWVMQASRFDHAVMPFPSQNAVHAILFCKFFLSALSKKQWPRCMAKKSGTHCAFPIFYCSQGAPRAYDYLTKTFFVVPSLMRTMFRPRCCVTCRRPSGVTTSVACISSLQAKVPFVFAVIFALRSFVRIQTIRHPAAVVACALICIAMRYPVAQHTTSRHGHTNSTMNEHLQFEPRNTFFYL